MKYPAIYQSTANGNVILLFAVNQGLVLDKCATIIGTSGEWNEAAFKNVTVEYLANTYGEVKSKAHAEFIVRLCESAGIEVGDIVGNNINWFSISDNLTMWEKKSSAILFGCIKQITIPLPPECETEDEWPKVGSSVEWGHSAEGEVKSLSDGFAWIKMDNKDYTTVYVSSLRKPKTPEQELREFLHLLWRENNEDFDDFADIAVLHLTKKGEGDE